MTRLYVTATALICLAAASWGATEVISPASVTVIEIAVAPSKLIECQQTLRDVAQQPAVHDNGTRFFFGISDDLPQVKCVVG